jgi:hypothetical protein
MPERRESERDNATALAVARQIATFNGQIFHALSDKQQRALIALAHSIRATCARLEDKRNVAW